MDEISRRSCLVRLTFFLTARSHIHAPLFRVLETMHTGFVLRILYYIVIISFGDGEKLAKIDWSLLVSLCTSSVCHVLTVCIILSKAIAVAEVRNETTFTLSL